MIRHLFVASFRNASRSPVQSLISASGLVIGLAAAILAGLVIVNQISFDDFLPLHARTYMVTLEGRLIGDGATWYGSHTPHDVAARLEVNFPEIEAVARIKIGDHSLRHGYVEAQESLYSADPAIFDVLRLPVLAGNLATALAEPDSIVIPGSIARKYFGRDNVAGETLELDRAHPLKIAAVVADLPANASNLQTAIFVSGRAPWSDMAVADKRAPNGRNNFAQDVQSLARLAAGASVPAIEARMLAMNQSLLPRPTGIFATLHLVRLDALHLSADYTPVTGESLVILAVAALLILFLSCVNFINLSTARAARRGIEVGVRKAAGAGRPALMAQFLGETVLQVLFALCAAMAVAEWCLPAVNAFLQSGTDFLYWRDPGLLGAMILGALAVGLLAGTYPAILISAFKPAAVLKGLMAGSPRAERVRAALVTSQIAILVLLAIAAGAVFEQHQFAIAQSLRFNTDQELFVPAPLCDGAFKDRVAALPGVSGVACADAGFLQHDNSWTLRHASSGPVDLNMVGTGPGLLELYGQHPLAGRLIRQTDQVLHGSQLKSQTAPANPVINMVLNETAVRQLGFASPQAAIGQVLRAGIAVPPVVIVGVVKDFAIATPEQKIVATGYSFFMQDYFVHVKLKGRDIPETLAAIDKAWNSTGANGPLQFTFMNAYVENLHLTLLRQSQMFAVFAAIAMLLASLGLFGLSLSTAERRTKEVGVRKAMGARNRDILGFLLWQFAKPVLWANLIAWPLAFWGLSQWLGGFAYHMAFPFWLFPAAGAATLLIALATVAGRALLVARQKPVLALRYE